MKIVYMGTPAFACEPLEHLCESRHEVQAVVTGPDKPSGRGRKLTPTPVSEQATVYGLTVLKPASLKDERLYQEIKTYRPDLIVVVAFRVLPERLFSLPKYGSVNVHASLLPKYRGPAPINWALINGEKETGLTSFYLKKKVDTGDIIHQERLPINQDENFDSLSERLSHLAGPFLSKTVDLIEQEKATPVPQDESMASPAPKITPYDTMLDFGFPARRVSDFVRGLSSRPGAYTYFRGKKLKILACRACDHASQVDIRPGTIVQAKKKLVIQCADSAIEIARLIPEGKKSMDGISFVNGFKPRRGEIMGETHQGGNTSQ